MQSIFTHSLKQLNYSIIILLASAGSNEWRFSVDCGANGIYDPPGPETQCRRVRFECSGIQVNALHGLMMQESCDHWP